MAVRIIELLEQTAEPLPVDDNFHRGVFIATLLSLPFWVTVLWLVLR